MAHRLVTPTQIDLAAMTEFKNNSALTMRVKRPFDARFGREGHKIGDTIDVRRPQRFESKEQRDLNLQDIYQSTVPVKLNKNRNIGLAIDEIQKMLSLERLREDIIGPQATQLANDVDFFLASMYKSVANVAGTPGTAITGLTPFLRANRILAENGCPQSVMRTMVYNPEMEESIVPALLALHNPQGQISNAFTEGEISRAARMSWVMSQNVAMHRIGPLGGTPAVHADSGGATAALDADGNYVQTLKTDGWTAAAALRLRKGDVIQIEGVKAVNPLSRQSTGRLQDFVLLADASSDGSGVATLELWPPIITSGALQTVDAAPAEDALISVFGKAAADQGDIADTDSPQALAFHKDAICMVMGHLPMPARKEGASIADKDMGISMRYVEDWDINSGTDKTRLEILYGGAVLRPEWVCRIVM